MNSFFRCLFLFIFSLSVVPLVQAVNLSYMQVSGFSEDGSNSAYDLVLDSNDVPHIAYRNNDMLWYAYWRKSGWVTEPIEAIDDTRDSGANTLSIAIQPDGKVAVAYSRIIDGDLRIAFRTGSGAWRFESVDPLGFHPKLKFTTEGSAHVLYWVKDSANRGLYWANNRNEEWVSQRLSNSSRISVNFDFAFDSTENIHVCYSGFWDSPLIHTVYDGENWVEETIETTGLNPSILIDSSDTVHLLYSASFTLTHSIKNEGSWRTETVLPGNSVSNFSATLDSQNNLLLVSNSQMFFYKFDGKSWSKGEEQLAYSVVPPKLTIDSTDAPHILHLYESSRRRSLFYSTTRDGWVGPEYVSNNVATVSAGAVDSNNVVHSVFYDLDDGMKYAIRESGSWRISDFPEYLQALSMATDSSGGVHVIGHGTTAIKYYYRLNDEWFSESIENVSGGYGYSTNGTTRTKIVVDANGTPHIAFANEYKAKYAKRYGPNDWRVESVGDVSTPSSGHMQVTDLALDTGGNPHVAFSNFSNFSESILQYARKLNNSWLVESVYRTRRTLNDRPVIALSREGRPHIIFKDYTELIHAFKNGENWETRILDFQAYSAALDIFSDTRGNLQFTYLSSIEYPVDTLRHGTLVDGNWVFDTVAKSVNSYSPIGSFFTFDLLGNGHVFYSRNSTAWPKEERRLVYKFDPIYGTTYDAWIAENFTSRELERQHRVTPDARPLVDGTPNLLRYAFLKDASSYFNPHHLISRDSAGRLKADFEYTNLNRNLNIELQESNDMIHWTAVAKSLDGGSFSATDGIEVRETGVGYRKSVSIADRRNIGDFNEFKAWRFKTTLNEE